MKIKKRNMVLEILLCAALISVVFLVYMGVAKNDSGLEIADISGDRAHLAEFSFDGLAGDESGNYHFTWDAGDLKTEYYPANGWGSDVILMGEKDGKTGFRKYFGNYDYGSFGPDTEIFPVAAGAVKDITELEELNEENQSALQQKMNDWYGGIPYGSTMTGYTADEIMLYAEVTDFDENRYSRFFTGMTLSGEEYYFTEWKDSTGSRIFYETSEQDMGISMAETEDAFYAILKTTEECEGEVFLQRIPKDKMAHGWGNDLLWKKAIRGETEVLCSFPVDAENRIIGMTKIGADRLLLARSENDTLLLELYDMEGNRITDLQTDVEQVSRYELQDIHLHHGTDQTMLWFELSRKVYDTDGMEGEFHYDVDGAVYYVCDENSIRELQVDGYAEYVDYLDGRVLTMEYQYSDDGDENLFKLLGFYITGYRLRVVDGETGELLYEGELTSDFTQDYYRKLTVLNIGRKAGYLSERPSRWDAWSFEEMERTEIRNFWHILPLKGELAFTDWSSGEQTRYNNYHYYG